MTVRTSAGIYLQVLEPAAAVATGIEIDVYDAANYARMMDTLEGARAVVYQKQLSQAGAGSFKINRHDGKATTQNLQKGNLCKVKIDGTYRGAFFAEETVRNLADISGAGAEDVEIKGRGVLAYLERAIVYPTGWPWIKLPDVTYTGVTRGAILKDQIDQAKARGGLVAMTYDFTAAVDSIGNPWTDTNTLTLHIGLNLFDLVRQMASLGTDFYMDPWLCLHAYQSLSIDRTGASGADAVVFRQGKHIGQKALSMDEHNSAVRSRLLVEGSGNNIQEVVDAPIEGDSTVGRREGYLSYTSSGDTQALNDAGEALMQQMAADAQPLQMTVTHGLSSLGTGEYEPFVDYDVGDYGLVDVPGAYDLAALRLIGLTIEQIDGGDFTVTGDFNSVYLEALIRIGQKTSGLSGGSSSSGSAPTGGGGAAGAGAGRAAVAVGDAPGYLYDKITAGAGIVKALTGSAPAETVSLSAVGGIPVGGTAGQGLVKIDGADYHAQWVTPSGGGGGALDVAPVQDATNTTSTNSIPVTLPGAPTNGNILLAMIGLQTAGVSISSITQTGVTWTQLLDSHTNARAAIWVGKAISSASASLTVNLSGSTYNSVVVAEFAGLAGTLASSAVGTGAGGNGVRWTPRHRPAADTLVIGLVAANNYVGIFSGGTGLMAFNSALASGMAPLVGWGWPGMRLSQLWGSSGHGAPFDGIIAAIT